MLPYRDSRIIVGTITTLFVLLAAYALFEARGLLFGPRIQVATGPELVREELVEIKGHVERISALYMNGSRIPVTENGDFAQPFLLSPGYNYILLDAEDRSGRKTHKRIELIYEPAAAIATTSPAASSTTPSSPRSR